MPMETGALWPTKVAIKRLRQGDTKFDKHMCCVGVARGISWRFSLGDRDHIEENKQPGEYRFCWLHQGFGC